MATSLPAASAAHDSPAPSTANSIKSDDTSTSFQTASAENSTEKVDKKEEAGKLRAFLGILRKFIGVSDIAAVRFSLPAQLLEPTPNLEYWNYVDRPDIFISMGDSDDEVGRMLEILRFWFSKDLKYVKGKPVKPYNSVLGEFFRSTWSIEDKTPTVHGEGDKISIIDNSSTHDKAVKICFLTEQTSHHPPVSAFYIECPEKGISARGFDQLSARFTGTSVKITPGPHNHGIFVKLQRRDDEEYQLTHPAAYLGGLLRGSLTVAVADTCFVTCPKTKLKVILHYLDENWLGKSQNKVHGVIYRYDPDNDKITRSKDVPEKSIVARIEGCWYEKLYYKLEGEKEQQLLIDSTPLWPLPKFVPPEEQQLPNESRRFWKDVTSAILSKQYSQATKVKIELEDRQRARAAERKEKNEEWSPRFFTGALTPAGRPELNDEGKVVLKGLLEGNYHLEESTVLGA